MYIEIKTIYSLITLVVLFVVFIIIVIIAMSLSHRGTAKRFMSYKHQTNHNIKKNIPHGEMLIINIFQEMFKKDVFFKDVVIYSHLEFRDWDNGQKKTNLNRWIS